MSLGSEHHPWEQRAGESAKAFHAFTHYRNLPAHERSLDAAHVEHVNECLSQDQDQTKSVPSQWKLWSTRHEWVSRSRAYDRHRDTMLRANRERDLVSTQERWLHAARYVQEQALAALVEKDFANEPVRELRLMITEAVRMEREALDFRRADNGVEQQERIREWLRLTQPSAEQVAAIFRDSGE